MSGFCAHEFEVGLNTYGFGGRDGGAATPTGGGGEGGGGGGEGGGGGGGSNGEMPLHGTIW